MRIPLAAMARRARNTRRREIVFRPVTIPATMASTLFAEVYRPVLSAWTEAIPALIEEYERSLGELTTDEAQDIGARIDRVESDLASLFVNVRVKLSAWVALIERRQRAKWSQVVLSATGVDISTMLGVGDVRATLGATIERNVGLVRSVSDEARGRIADSVFRGLRERKPAREVAKELQEHVAMSRRRAMNIASDQTTKIASELQRERRRQAGIGLWAWVHSGKVHFRPEHKARDGKRYSDDNAPADLPGELPFCGCTERAVLSLDDDEF